VLPAALLACALLGVAASADGASDGSREYVVLYEQGASGRAAREAIKDAGGRIVDENRAIGVATVRTDDTSFVKDVASSPAIVGATANRFIGRAPNDAAKVRRDAIERPAFANTRGKGRRADGPAGGDPLSPKQWDMQMMDATPTGSYRRQQGSKAVRVGIIDTGIDGSHPDIKPNFDRGLSRNFTVDDPTIDGACDTDPDHSCQDPADVDEDGHGTHVASTIGSPLNGIGMAGVAPKVDLVNLRAGQDSGFFFLGPVVNALTYAGDHGIDVVNMSFYIDPWLYNCRANPADSPQEQRDQALIIEATQRAIDYARRRGVTTIAAEGNGHTDLGKPTSDATSPDYPVDPATGEPANARPRTIDNSCLSMPTEADGVIGVTSVGPSKRKAYYSDYGIEQADVSAPGGDARDTAIASPENMILAAYPKSVGLAEGRIDPTTGAPTTPAVVEQGGAYYQAIQGTSMASPHAVGVAALIVAQYGKQDRRHGGLTMAPAQVERILRGTAVDTACPTPATFVYPAPVPASYTATCEGTADRNGFYGDGIVNALRAVTAGDR
jgi:subtilisin family serine protease